MQAPTFKSINGAKKELKLKNECFHHNRHIKLRHWSQTFKIIIKIIYAVNVYVFQNLKLEVTDISVILNQTIHLHLFKAVSHSKLLGLKIHSSLTININITSILTN
jgi:hypothetical protein